MERSGSEGAEPRGLELPRRERSRRPTPLDQAIPARLADREGLPVGEALDPHRCSRPPTGRAGSARLPATRPARCPICPLLRRAGAPGGFGREPVRGRPLRPPPPSRLGRAPRSPLVSSSRASSTSSPRSSPISLPIFFIHRATLFGSSSFRSPEARRIGEGVEPILLRANRREARHEPAELGPPQRGQLGGVGSEIRMTRRLTARRQSAHWYS